MRKMKIVVCMLLFLQLFGCGNSGQESAYKTAGEEGTAMVSMEDWEEQLLLDMYTTEIEQTHVQSGELYDYQETALTQIRKLGSYLEGKYPEHSFQITGIEQPHTDQSYVAYCFTADGEETEYWASADSWESEDFQDGYYAALLEPVYDAWLLKELTARDISVVAVYTDFTAQCGSEITGQLTAEEISGMGSELPRDTAIYCTNAEKEQVQAAIDELGLYGAFRLYTSTLFQADMDADRCRAIWRENKSSGSMVAFRGKG